MSIQQPIQRRVFLSHIVAGGTAVIALGAQAQLLEEKDPQAAALGYIADGAKVDTKKYPKYAADQKCSSCQLYTGKAGEAAGPCSIFAGKQVTAAGWCSVWAKKAG